MREPWGLAVRSHEAALTEAMRRVRLDLEARPPGTRSVVLAHAFVTGCAPSESERDISVGGVSMVPVSLFDDISYTALGHLHGAPVLSDAVRYSGSPLAYSFSEETHTKGSWLIDLDDAGVAASEFVAAPVPRRLAGLRGTVEELLADPALATHEDSWVHATLTDAVRPLRAMDRLRTRFPHTLVIGFAPAGSGTAPRLLAPTHHGPVGPRDRPRVRGRAARCAGHRRRVPAAPRGQRGVRRRPRADRLVTASEAGR